MSPPVVSVIIPTQRRPVGLGVASRSVLAQVGVPVAFELVVVDNDAVPSALATVQGLELGRIAVRHVHEPRPGVAHARNAGLAAARGEWIAFLDDDEEAPSGWLAALLATQARHDADVVFGPVRGRVPETAGVHRAYLAGFFSRVGPEAEGPLDDYYGCGNSLIRRQALPHPTSPFALERNEIGGEDDLLFAQMKSRGATFAWAPEAWVWEDPIPARVTLRYALKRAFIYGQGPSEHCASAGDRLGVARWMAIGAGQAVVFGAIAAAAWLLRRPDRAKRLDQALRGLGKVLWFGPFKHKLYGHSGG